LEGSDRPPTMLSIRATRYGLDKPLVPQSWSHGQVELGLSNGSRMRFSAAYSCEIQDEMIAQAEHGAPDEADAEGFWPDLS
jgi:hypothetical protein